jgi:beta-glucanase (GH16 family)
MFSARRPGPFTSLSGTSSSATGCHCPWSGDSSDSAEIDIAEGDPGSTTSVFQNVFNSSAGVKQTCTSPTISDYSQNFHTYELDWSPESLVFGSGVPSNPMFLIIDGDLRTAPTSLRR